MSSGGSIGRSSGPQPWDTYSKTDDDNLKVARVSSTDNAIVRFDGTSGLVQNSSVVIDDSGNVGIGVTPSSWVSGTKALDVLNCSVFSTGGTSGFSSNAYYTGGGVYNYKTSDYATLFKSNSGVHTWMTAPSGTAGNAITWNQAMTLDPSGNVGIGTSSPTQLLTLYTTLASGSGVGTAMQICSDGSGGDNGWIGVNKGTGNGLVIGVQNRDIIFQTGNSSSFNGTERMRINSSGNLLFNSGYGSVATAYGCRAWVKFVGSNGSINGSANVSSVTYNATGNWWINFSNSMPDGNYSAVGSGSGDSYNIGIYNQDASRVNMASAVPAQYMVNPSWVDIAVFR